MMCVRKTLLAEVFYFLPGNGARKYFAAEFDGGRLFFFVPQQRSLCVVNDQPVGNPKRKV
jgi:hypothetical protein